MYRYLLIIGIVLVSLTTFQLYEVSYNSNDIRKNIRLLETEIAKEKEKINRLRLKHNQLMRPENISALNEYLLHLKPQEIAQFITIDTVPTKAIIDGANGDNLSIGDKEIYDPIGELSAQIVKEN